MRPRVFLISACIVSLTGCGTAVITQSSPRDVFLNFVPMQQDSHTYAMQYIVETFASAVDNTKYDPSQVTGTLNISQDSNDGSYKVDWKLGTHDFQFILSHDGTSLTEVSNDAQALSLPDFGIMSTSDTTLYNNWHH